MLKFALLQTGQSCIYAGAAILCASLLAWAIRPNSWTDAWSVLGGGMVAIGLGMIVTALWS